MTLADAVLTSIDPASIRLLDGQLSERRKPTHAYLRSLTDDNLLRPYRFQAGLWSWSGTAGTTVGATVADGPDQWHWGWEAPTSQLRGHILGHWLSAAAHLRHGDRVLAARSDDIIDALEQCQVANGDGWIAPFGPEHLERVAEGRPAWAPHYVVHKLLAGLLDHVTLARQPVAERILRNAAGWFERFTRDRTREQLDDILDVETGGMLEIWAGMLEHTGEQLYRTLLSRYRRGRFFDALRRGEDVLTNKHANTQIPEILGCARAFDATGNEEWFQIVEAFWDQAVIRRGTYVTGGSSSAEIWQPIGDQSARTQDVQEHCTVFNMMRLADWLYRWTGDSRYAEYWERNLANGILAQQHAGTGMVAYFLSLDPGARKTWGRELEDFWCCHGTLLQAHTDQLGAPVHIHDGRLRISQWLPSEIEADVEGGWVHVQIRQNPVRGLAPGWSHPRPGTLAIQELHRPAAPIARPSAQVFTVVNCRTDTPAEIEVRIPHWAVGADVSGAGVTVSGDVAPGNVVTVQLAGGAEMAMELGVALTVHRLPGHPERFAFADGPLVLAGLCDTERQLIGDSEEPATMVRPSQERTHSWWSAGRYHTRDIDNGFLLVPLQEITDEKYTVFFTAKNSSRQSVTEQP